MNSMTAEEAYREAIKSGWSQELEQIVIDSGSPYWAYQFASTVESANVSKLVDLVLKKDPEMIMRMFKNRPDLRRKYEMNELRKQIRKTINEGWLLDKIKALLSLGEHGGATGGGGDDYGDWYDGDSDFGGI